jgi:poly-beta-1,6-N-acetyl-D-glucosamine N-deacetylase
MRSEMTEKHRATTRARSAGRCGRWRRRVRALTVAAGLIAVLGGAGYAFVLKSFPYQTPQELPPRVVLTRGIVADFTGYLSGLAEVPVLTWRDVSHRTGALVTTPDAFATQLAVLRHEGYQSIGLGTLEAVAAGRPVRLPSRPIVFTFDDGLSTDWTTVDPILRRYGFRAVAFINPANVASKSPSYFLTRSELAAMASSGRWDVGLELPGGWQSSQEASVAVTQALSQLEGDAGRQVIAFGWPALRFFTASQTTEPVMRNALLRKQFALVFGRPAAGDASFVVGGSADRPLPRVNVTAADSLRSLSLRLRAGVQAPPPRNLLGLPWRSAGGHCRIAGRTLEVTGSHFALCTVLANGARWIRYGLRLSIAATSGDTAIVDLHVSRTGCLEIAFGASELSIKQRSAGRWELLRQVRVAADASPSLIGAGALQVSISLAGRTLSLHVQDPDIRYGLSVRQSVSPRVQSGVIALGLAAHGKPARITFRQVTVVMNA